jgi:GT2 family glycosyltransferase
VDNASNDNSVEMVRRDFPQVNLIESAENLGYSKANNLGMRAGNGKDFLLLNSDTIVDPAILGETLRLLRSDPQVGVLGCRLVGLDGKEQRSHHFDYPFGPWIGSGEKANSNGLIECAYLWGAYFLVKREVIEQVGMLDEDFFLFYEDIDWCWRMHKAGWKIAYDPEHSITHVCRASCNRVNDFDRQVMLFISLIILRTKHDPNFIFRKWRRGRLLLHARCVLWYGLLSRIFFSTKKKIMVKLNNHLVSYVALKSMHQPPPYNNNLNWTLK